MDDVAGATGLTSDAVLQTFCDHVLTVSFWNVPGNAFLGRLPPVMNLSRRKEPRVRIRPGKRRNSHGPGMITRRRVLGGGGKSVIHPCRCLIVGTNLLLSLATKCNFGWLVGQTMTDWPKDIAEGLDVDELSEAVSQVVPD